MVRFLPFSDAAGRHAKPALAFGGSLLLHLGFLGVLALIVLPSLSNQSTPGTEVRFVETVVNRLDREQPAQLVKMTPEESSASATAGLSSVDLLDMPTKAPEFQVDALHALPQAEAPAVGSLTQTIKQSGRGRAQGGKPSATGSGNGEGKKGFFGLPVEEKRVVFVVDASRSMNMPHQGPSRTRINRVKQELVKTISEMTEDQNFFIIFFNDTAIPMPARQLVAAEPAARERYLNWMRRMIANGQTFPLHALLLALRLEPDSIYFLTDGEFQYSTVPNVTLANQNHVAIHTIGFASELGERLLREIAERNQGTYRFIPPDEAVQGKDAGQTAVNILAPLGQ